MGVLTIWLLCLDSVVTPKQKIHHGRRRIGAVSTVEVCDDSRKL